MYAREPLSGRGAQLYGGRFNLKGVPALYTALTPDTAIRESNQVGSLQPTMLVSYLADIKPVFDALDANTLEQYGMSHQELSSPGWRDQISKHGVATTQRFAQQLIADGFAGLLVRSFARGTGARDINLVLWSWSSTVPAQLHVIDDENRLPGFSHVEV